MSHHEGKKKAAGAAGTALLIERTLDAPCNLVWKFWSEPDRMKLWWAPKPFTAPVVKIDFRVGGRFLGAMRSPEGKDIWSTGVYREIKPLERIVSTDSFADEQGNVVPASRYGFGEGFPLELLLTVTFEDVGGKTKVTVKHEGFPSGPDKEGAQEGWSSSLNALAQLVRQVA